MGGQKRGSVVVITEYLPRCKDATIRNAVRTTYGNDIIGTEIVSVANLKHFLRNGPVLGRLTLHLEDIAKRDGLRGILVIAEGGSHRTAVRALRRRGILSRNVTGITVHADTLPRVIAVAPTDRSLYGERGVEWGVAQAYSAASGAAVLTVPGGLFTLSRDNAWRTFLIDGLRALTSRGKRRHIVLLNRPRVDRRTTEGDVIAVRERIADALPGVPVDIADTTRCQDRSIVVRPILRAATA